MTTNQQKFELIAEKLDGLIRHQYDLWGWISVDKDGICNGSGICELPNYHLPENWARLIEKVYNIKRVKIKIQPYHGKPSCSIIKFDISGNELSYDGGSIYYITGNNIGEAVVNAIYKWLIKEV